MKGFDEKALYRLQDAYLGSKTPETLSALYYGLLSASQTLLKSRLTKLGKHYPPDCQKIIAHDAVTRLMEMYLKRPNQGPIPLTSRLNLEIRFQLHNPKTVRQNQEAELLEIVPVGQKAADIPIYEYFNRVADNSEVDGRRVIVDLYRHKYYKQAILAIAKYTKRQWIYNHCKELRNIWLMTRGNYGD